MAVTLVVLSGSDDGSEKLSLTLDTPRLVIGRGPGCEVRLPDASVSHRHASLRQRGGEYVLMDEHSQNGTFLGAVRLPPQTPRVIRSGERMRVGRVWIEVRMEPAIVKGSTAAAAKEVAIALVARGLKAQGEEPGPRLTVIGGPDNGKAWSLEESGRTYVVGAAEGSDLMLTDPAASDRHATLVRTGDTFTVHDCGTPRGTLVGGDPVGPAGVVWKTGEVMAIGASQITFDYLAAQVLLEIEESPEERLGVGTVSEPPSSSAVGSSPMNANDEEAERAPTAPSPGPSLMQSKQKPDAGWGLVDGAVVLLALFVLIASLVAAWWMLGR